MLAVYRHTYGPIDWDEPWPLFWSALKRVGQFAARERLAVLDGVSGGVALAFDPAGAATAVRDSIMQIAYPGDGGGPRFAKNLARKEAPDG